jgi:phosphoglycolate phosphatase-like HAD superfamily hydrolase
MIAPYTIYCDMDGVLVDLYKGMREVLGRAYDSPHWHESGEDKRDIIRDHPNFWENLPPMRDFNTLWSFIKPFNPCILTAYAEWDEKDSKREKFIWNLKYTKVPKNRFFCVAREEKQLYAVNAYGRPNVLIDDFKLNIQEWRKAGGIGIMHTDAEHTIMKLKNIGFQNEEATRN